MGLRGGRWKASAAIRVRITPNGARWTPAGYGGEHYPHPMRILSTLLLMLALTACGSGDDSAGDESPNTSTTDAAPAVDFATVQEACAGEVFEDLMARGHPELGAKAVMRVGDDGASLDVSPSYDGDDVLAPIALSFASVVAAKCVLRETEAPDAVVAQVNQVSAIDGRQEAEWDGVSLSYSYHPESGFTGVFTATS